MKSVRIIWVGVIFFILVIAVAMLRSDTLVNSRIVNAILITGTGIATLLMTIDVTETIKSSGREHERNTEKGRAFEAIKSPDPNIWKPVVDPKTEIEASWYTEVLRIGVFSPNTEKCIHSALRLASLSKNTDPDALTGLQKALQHESTSIMLTAANHLAAYQTVDSVRILIDYVEVGITTYHPNRLQQVVAVLGETRHHDAIEVLQKILLQNTNSHVREATFIAIGKCGLDEDVHLIMEHLRSAHGEGAKNACVRGLGYVLEKSSSKAYEALVTILDGQKTHEDSVRRHVIEQFRLFGSDRELNYLQSHSNPTWRAFRGDINTAITQIRQRID